MSPGFKFFIAAVVAVVLAVLSIGWAHSDTLRGDRGSCSHFSTIVHGFGEMRDQGAPWELVELQIDQMVAAALASPETSYVTNEADAKWVKGWIKALFDNKDDPAIMVAATMFNDCMKVPAASKRKIML